MVLLLLLLLLPEEERAVDSLEGLGDEPADCCGLDELLPGALASDDLLLPEEELAAGLLAAELPDDLLLLTDGCRLSPEEAGRL